MSRTFRPLLSALLLLLAAVPAKAAPRTLSDLAEDSRLRKPVTLARGKAPLGELLTELGERAGVSLRAAPEIADEPAILFVSTRPAAEVMKRIGAHFNFRWKGMETAQGIRWELYQDLKSRQEEAAARNADRQAALRRLLDELALRLALSRKPTAELLAAADRFDDARQERMVNRLPHTPEMDLMRQEGSSWGFRELAKPGTPLLLRLLHDLPPSAWERLWSGEALRFSSREEPGYVRLDPDWVQTFRAAPPALFPPGARLKHGQPDGEEITRQLDERMKSQWLRAVAYRLRVLLDVKLDDGETTAILSVSPTTVLPPDSEGGQHMNATGLKIEAHVSSPDGGDADPAVGDPVLARTASWNPPRRATGPGDPSFDWLNDELAAAARLFGLNLIADAYRHAPYPLGMPLPNGPTTLRDWLRTYVSPIARWERTGEWLLVRRRRWFNDRLAEIPKRVLDRWETHLRVNPTLSADSLGRLAVELSDAQLPHFAAAMRPRGIEFSDEYQINVTGSARSLRLWGLLTPAQREQLRAGKELRARALSRGAAEALRVLYDRLSREEEVPPRGDLAESKLETIPMSQAVTAAPDGYHFSWRSPDQREWYSGFAGRGFAPPLPGPIRDGVLALTTTDGMIRYFYARSPGVRVQPRSTPPAS